ncbi:MAG: ABC transporter permease [Chloroflexi bacterium]|nr:ABC transporter permease [Chloroflexota bacterium]
MSLRTLVQMTIAQATIVSRNVSYWLISIFIAVFSMAVFGWLFNPETRAFDLAIADQDRSQSSEALVQAFTSVENADISRDSLQKEMERFNDGDRAAVLVIPNGFADRLSRGRAAVRVAFDNSDLIRAGYVQTTVNAVIDKYNREVVGVRDAVVVRSQAQETASTRFIDFLTPGMVGMTIMWTNLAVGYMLITWREQGILRRLGVTPLRPGALIASQAMSFALISLAQAVIILAMGRLVFDVHINGSYILLGVTVVLGVMAMLSIGYVIASFLRTITAANAVGNLVAFPMMFLGRSYFPLDAPTALQPIVKALPLTYLNDALRDLINHGNGIGDLWLDWAVLAAWTAGGFLLSIRVFRWQ